MTKLSQGLSQDRANMLTLDCRSCFLQVAVVFSQCQMVERLQHPTGSNRGSRVWCSQPHPLTTSQASTHGDLVVSGNGTEQVDNNQSVSPLQKKRHLRLCMSNRKGKLTVQAAASQASTSSTQTPECKRWTAALAASRLPQLFRHLLRYETGQQQRHPTRNNSSM